MSDARRRAVEREAARGDVAAAARALRERLRAGELSPERLRLAAALAHPAATDALGGGAPAIPQELPALAATIAEAGEEAAERAALAAAWSADGHPSEPDDFALALRIATRFTVCPCDEHARAVLHLQVAPKPLEWLDRGEERIGAQDLTAALIAVVARRARACASAGGSLPPADGREPLAAGLRRALEDARASAIDEPVPEMGFIEGFDGLARHFDGVAAWWRRNHAVAAERLCAIVRREVAAWALGEDDPLRRRAAAAEVAPADGLVAASPGPPSDGPGLATSPDGGGGRTGRREEDG